LAQDCIIRTAESCVYSIFRAMDEVFHILLNI